MAKWYAVISKFSDDGSVTANIADVIESGKKPDNSYSVVNNSDVYVDWFESKEYADLFIDELLNS